MEKPQVIFFDAVGTLFDVRGTVGEIYGRFAQQVGLTVDPEALQRAFMHSFRVAPRSISANSLPLERREYDWWRSVAFQSFEQVGVQSKIPDFDAFFQPLFDYFATASPWILYPEVPQTLSALKGLEIDLAIISNFDSRLYSVLKALDLDQWFTSVTLSTQVGIAKPDSGIFEAALVKHALSSAQAWHVGDSWNEDYQGATAAGLQGIWLNRHPSQIKPAEIVVDSLSMLELVLESKDKAHEQRGK